MQRTPPTRRRHASHALTDAITWDYSFNHVYRNPYVICQGCRDARLFLCSGRITHSGSRHLNLRPEQNPSLSPQCRRPPTHYPRSVCLAIGAVAERNCRALDWSGTYRNCPCAYASTVSNRDSSLRLRFLRSPTLLPFLLHYAPIRVNAPSFSFSPLFTCCIKYCDHSNMSDIIIREVINVSRPSTGIPT